jgi:hypothetical protein
MLMVTRPNARRPSLRRHRSPNRKKAARYVFLPPKDPRALAKAREPKRFKSSFPQEI